MTNIAYPVKTVAGDATDSYVEGNTLPASELQGDFDEVKSVVNGQLDEDNIRAGAQIESSKLAEVDAGNVSDHSETAAVARQEATVGDTSTAGSNLATSLEEELEGLRYRIHAMSGHRLSSSYIDTSDVTQDSTWLEPGISGPNLVANPGFEYHGGATALLPPEHWTLVATPTNIAIESADEVGAGGHKRSLNIACDAADEGIQQTFAGLKASTKYIFGCAYVVSLSGIKMSVTGGLGSGDYKVGALTDTTGTSLETMQLIVKTDSSATDMVLNLLSTDTTSEFNVYYVWMHELSDDSYSQVPHIPHQTAENSTQLARPVTFNVGWNWETVSDLTISQYIPGPGYRLIYEVRPNWTGESGIVAPGAQVGLENEYGFRVQLDSGGGAATVDGPVLIYNCINNIANMGIGNTMMLRHIVENPTPGATYTFTLDVGAYDDGVSVDGKMMMSPLGSGAVQSISKAFLIIDRI
jgi:hypothetical protein